MSSRIEQLNDRAKNLYSKSSYSEDSANELMKEHYELGNIILNAYEEGKINIEYVKLSSMLDYLNTIGNSYEDLITISAKKRITNLTDITNEVNKAKSLVQDNQKFDMVYPNKIYKFAQDLLDTSNYILGIKEENDIKTGLINSKAMHAKYLADWAIEFSKIYMHDSLKPTIKEIKSKNTIVEINNTLDSMLKDPSIITLEAINSLYEKEFEDFSIDKKEITELYKKIYEYYVKEDAISTDTVKETLNKLINLYNNNTDIDLSKVTDCITDLKNIYENSIETDLVTVNYVNKKYILNESKLANTIVETLVKAQADEEANNIKVNYNTNINIPTNKNVTITINLPNDKSYIEDYPNNNITFYENGKKDIIINIRGYKYKYSLEINNINKSLTKLTCNIVLEKGDILNWEDDFVTAELYSSIKKIDDYKGEQSINKTGLYSLISKNKEGNKCITNFIVVDKYYNDENKECKYLKIRTDNTKVSEIKKYIDSEIKRKNTSLSDDEVVLTGDKINTKDGEIIIIVRGDITEKGNCSIVDLVKMRTILIKTINLSAEQKNAADINDDGKVSIIDLAKIRCILVGKHIL